MAAITTQWAHFPRSKAPPSLARSVVAVFNAQLPLISSAEETHSSDDVLRFVRPGLEELGFEVETGKKAADKVKVPVLFGRNGVVDKSFDADAYHADEGFVLEVEAGRAVANNQFLKDLFQACMMHEVRYLATAVRLTYDGGNRRSRDFETVCTFYDTLFSSARLQLPLDGVVIIGY